MEYAAGAVLLLYAVMMATSLGARQEPVAKLAKMVGAWLAIFAGGFLLFTYVDVNDVKQRVSSELSGSAIVEDDGSIKIPMRQDGHFWVEAEINGEPVDFLVDTGATITTVDRRVAERTGLAMLEGAQQQVQTANGSVLVGVGRAKSLSVGSIREQDVMIQVSDIDDVNVLGMNFLRKLGRWGVEGRFLVLEP